jgi:hypothetical protein
VGSFSVSLGPPELKSEIITYSCCNPLCDLFRSVHQTGRTRADSKD